MTTVECVSLPSGLLFGLGYMLEAWCACLFFGVFVLQVSYSRHAEERMLHRLEKMMSPVWRIAVSILSIQRVFVGRRVNCYMVKVTELNPRLVSVAIKLLWEAERSGPEDYVHPLLFEVLVQEVEKGNIDLEYIEDEYHSEMRVHVEEELVKRDSP